jgi:hypothetical protein
MAGSGSARRSPNCSSVLVLEPVAWVSVLMTRGEGLEQAAV